MTSPAPQLGRAVLDMPLHDFSWERMATAVEEVRDRALRTTAALRGAGIPHAIVGGHAVASWVSRVDVQAVRNTRDVDLLLRRADLPQAVGAMQAAGFVHQNVAGVDMFLAGSGGSPRSAVHVIFAGEKTRPEHAWAAPDVTDLEDGPGFPVPSLEALVRRKLTAFRLKDRVHLIDLLDVGLIDERWCERLPEGLSARLREVIRTRDEEA